MTNGREGERGGGRRGGGISLLVKMISFECGDKWADRVCGVEGGWRGGMSWGRGREVEGG